MHIDLSSVRLACQGPAAVLLAALLGHLAAGPLAAVPERPSEEELRLVETRGRRIASYHEAVARTRAKYEKHMPDLDESVRWVVVDRGGSWRVILMRPVSGQAEPKAWQMLAEVGFNYKAGEVTTFERYMPPRQAPADALALQRAIDAAASVIALYVPDSRAPFEVSAFKEADKTCSVYLQATPESGVQRFGSDLFSTVSGDGMKVTKSTPLHVGTPAMPVAASAAGEPTLHSHVEGDLPAETDVAMVIEHPKLAPHLVLTPRYMFRIDQAGAITYLGPNQVPPAAPGGTN